MEWEGIVNFNGKDIKVTVYITKPTENNFGDWYGYGYTDSIEFETGNYNTNIGTVLINNLTIKSNETYFKFLGSGKPKGDLQKFIENS